MVTIPECYLVVMVTIPECYLVALVTIYLNAIQLVTEVILEVLWWNQGHLGNTYPRGTP